MQFKLRKLPKAKAAALTSFSIDTAEPLRPLPAPIYVLLAKNEKLVSIKGPFDFFTARDLVKMKLGGQYFYGPILRQVEPFLETAREVKKMLIWNQPSATKVLEPSPFEISDAILRKMAELWASLPSAEGESEQKLIAVESYFAVAFTNELCEPIPGDCLDEAREKDPDLYEIALLRSGVFVFLALHLGYQDLKRLSDLRYRFFNELVPMGASGENAPLSMELADLKRWTEMFIHSPDVHLISNDLFQYSLSRVSQKLRSRLARVRADLTNPESTLSHAADEGEVSDVG